MNNIINLLLRASLSASLSNREAFVDRISGIIESQTGKDPEAAKNMSNNIATAMDGINEQLLIEQLLKPQADDELNKKIDRLTEAVEKLTTTVNQLITQTETNNSEKK